ncbi:ACT domain-containing protein [Daldinia caldariorum]|uniref:ACT domain-containing protein n=1 Tax=Daldinia caldariorum TaxID=326644 RepID=UPI002007CCE7|nr:ACT domain-containing protein [Daldinia caldariorum]KAI1470004.1 ACT domain-containing protein [Daldinia caldariorum]
MNAQISFLDGTFRLIHIPLQLYPNFLQPILQVLLPQDDDDSLSNKAEGLSIDNRHGFLNISVTPVECSVVCHSSWASNVFEPVIKRLPSSLSKTVTISKDTYLILSVISAGMDAGSRVMDLTSPLALAGVPIFFITTYYSDFILVPSKDRQTVVQVLLARNFEFDQYESAYVSPSAMSHVRGRSQGSEPPSTPPPSTVAELQVRTFELLKKRNVVPYISPCLSLVQCSGRDLSRLVDYSRRPSLNKHQSGNGHRRSWLDNVDTKLYTSLISVLAKQPRFLSITLAQEDPPSLLLDREYLSVFGDSLVGDTEGDLVPIFLDLVNLPLEATGIVSGVAGKLISEMGKEETDISGELSYLSTAQAGAVILSSKQSMRALEVLKPLLSKE